MIVPCFYIKHSFDDLPVSLQAQGMCEEDGGEALFGPQRRTCGVSARGMAIKTPAGWRLVSECVYHMVPCLIRQI